MVEIGTPKTVRTDFHSEGAAMGRRRKDAEPEMRFHAHSGQARVRVDGKVIYLGPWDSPEAKEQFHRLLAEWHAGNSVAAERPKATRRRRALAVPAAAVDDVCASASAGLTVAEICVLWEAHCQKKYTRADGTQSSTIHETNMIIRALEPDAAMPAASFKARALVTLQQRLVADGRPRVTVNRIVKGVRRLFRWATVMEYVPETVVPALEAVEPLRKGQTEAAETEPVTDVPDQNVETVLAHLPRIVADLVRFIRLAGCRPGEACMIRPMDIDTSQSEWKWTVPEHKTSWRGHDRTYWLGPQAQAILGPYLRRSPTRYCFSPAESERERCAWRRWARQSPMTPSQAARTPKPQPMCKPGEHYKTSSLACAIKRACRRANVTPWTSMQLRHNAGTEAREQLGLDAAQARLGHRQANVTQVYASVTDRRKREVARLLG
jgi:integrase